MFQFVLTRWVKWSGISTESAARWRVCSRLSHIRARSRSLCIQELLPSSALYKAYFFLRLQNTLTWRATSFSNNYCLYYTLLVTNYSLTGLVLLLEPNDMFNSYLKFYSYKFILCVVFSVCFYTLITRSDFVNLVRFWNCHTPYKM